MRKKLENKELASNTKKKKKKAYLNAKRANESHVIREACPGLDPIASQCLHKVGGQ